MKWNEYKELSEKTLSQEFFVTKKDELLLHAVIGVLTEMEELMENNDEDEVNLFEEVGDVTWYLAIIGREYDITFPDTLTVPPPLFDKTSNSELVLQVVRKSCLLLDFMKKKLYYNKPINDEMFKNISIDIMTVLNTYVAKNNLNIEDIYQNNIDKLRARYGEKFTSERAINRDLDTERKILEGGHKTN